MYVQLAQTSPSSPTIYTTILGKYWGFIYGHTDIVPSRLIHWPMWSSLPVCILSLLMLIANGCHKYHKGYCWPRISFYVHIELLSANLQHFPWLVYDQLGTHPLQFIHVLHDSKLSCFSFSRLILVWMYYEQLTYCPHKYMKDWILEYSIF